MTREEKINAFTMRLDGHTYQEIGDKYGLSKERIHQILTWSISGRRKGEKHIYRNIDAWMREGRISQRQIADAIGASPSAVSAVFSGKCRPGFALITYLCDAMGQPPSYVFAKGGYDEAL